MSQRRQGLAGTLEDPRLPAASPVVTCSDDSCSGRAGQARPDRAGQARPGPGSTGRRRAGSTPRSCTGCRRRPGCAGPGSPIGRSGWLVRGRSASARSQSGPNRSGPGGRSRGSPRRWAAVRARAAGSPPPATPLQHRPYLPGWTAAPGAARTIQVPHAVHPEAGVQSQVRLHPDEPSACRATPPPGPPGRRGRPWRAAGPGSRCGSASGRRAPHGGAARPATPCRPGHMPIVTQERRRAHARRGDESPLGRCSESRGGSARCVSLVGQPGPPAPCRSRPVAGAGCPVRRCGVHLPQSTRATVARAESRETRRPATPGRAAR